MQRNGHTQATALRAMSDHIEHYESLLRLTCTHFNNSFVFLQKGGVVSLCFPLLLQFSFEL